MQSGNRWSLRIWRLGNEMFRRATAKSPRHPNSIASHRWPRPTVAEVLEDRILLCADPVLQTVDSLNPAFADFDTVARSISFMPADGGETGAGAVSEDLRIPVTGFTAADPSGSLIFMLPISGDISVGGEIDAYDVSLDMNQTVSVTLRTDSSLQGILGIFDSSDGLLASMPAAGTGDPVVLQTVPADDAGAYSVKVGGVSGTTGAYRVEIVLNAMVEAEQFGGVTNDTILTAQDLTTSFIVPAAGTEERGAVLGTAQSATSDIYSFGLETGESVSLAVAGSVDLELLNSGGTLVASGIAAANLNEAINNFVSTVTDTYFAVISAAADNQDYSLIVTREADFDTENNSSFDFAQDITGMGSALGFVLDAGGNGQFDTPLVNIDGQGFNGVAPPDTVGDVGLNYYIQAINHTSGSQVTIYNKADGSVVAGPFMMDDLASGGPGADGAGDPIVLFDHLAGRWLLSEFSDAADGLSVFISQTSDPTTGNWHEYFFATPWFPDYPKFSVWPDGYYVSTNELSPAVYVLDRDNMLLGNVARPIQRFTAPNLAGFNFQALTPADLDGPAPPTDAPGIFMRHRDDEVHNAGSNDPAQDFLEVWEFHTDFDTPANSSFGKLIDIPISEIDSDLCGLLAFQCFPQPGTTTTLDPLREVIMWRLQYRNFGTHESLVGNLTTDVDGTDHGGVRWFELRRTGGLVGTWSLYQEGTIAPDEHNRWMGAISMDGSGNIAVGYNVSSSTIEAGLRYTGRLAEDPLGTMPQGEHILVNGIGAQTGNTRWGDYSAMSIDPVDDETFWFTGEYADTGNWSTRIGAFVLNSPTDSDFYRLEVNHSDALVIETFTPLDGLFDPLNELDPVIELIAPDGSSVTTDDNSAADSHNALITHTAVQSGSYRIRVSGTGSTSGAYVVRVTGSTGVNQPPSVIATTPVDGGTVGTFPAVYTLNFSEAVDPTTVSAGDLLIGGLPATGLIQIDGDTFRFDVDAAAYAGEGTYSTQLTADNVSDFQGLGNTDFSGTFILDSSGPRVTSTLFNGSTLPVDRILAPGPLTFTALFNEALKVFFRGRGGLRTPTAEDVILANTTTGDSFTATAVNSNLALTQFTADFAALPEGAYTLTLVSGDEAFEDQLGHDLDGEPVGTAVDGTPTGDGSPGGNYVVNFYVDTTTPALNSFARLAPLGSLVSYSPGNVGVLHESADQDDFSMFLERGEILAAELEVDSAVIGTVEIVELSLVSSSPLAGQPAVLAPAGIPADGNYTVRVTADGATGFNLNLFRNTALETVVGDTVDGHELAIDNSFIPLGSGRFAVQGISAAVGGGPVQFSQTNDPGLFVDISATGAALGLSDDGEVDITTTVGNTIFPSGDVTVGNNGGILGGSGGSLGFLTLENLALPSADLGLALLPFWDDMDSDSGDVYWEERLVGGINTLIVQWENRPHYSNIGSGTFQVQLFESGPVLARYAYEDVYFGDASYDFGASATIGYQESASVASQFSFNTAMLSDGDVLDLVAAVTADVDEYEVDLTGKAGQLIDVVLAGHDGVSFAGELLELLDVDGSTVLATGSTEPIQAGTTVTSFDLGIADFTVPTDGIYTIRVTSNVIGGHYSVLVTDPLTFDSEPNGLITDPLRSLDATTAALGFVWTSGDTVDLYTLTVAENESVVVSTETPFNNSSKQPLNDLDPQLEVIHPDGSTVVASDENSAADGINVELTFCCRYIHNSRDCHFGNG